MMALGDILAARAYNAGTLGTVTVEALPVRELERLVCGADGDRAVFYAACRELQGAGAALLHTGAGEAVDTDKRRCSLPGHRTDARRITGGQEASGSTTRRTVRTKARADRTHMRRTRMRKSDLPSCR